MNYRLVLDRLDRKPHDFFEEFGQAEACYLTDRLPPAHLDVALRYYGIHRDPQNMTRIAEEMVMRKNVRFSRHAIQRKLEREFSDDDIAETMAAPDYILTTEEGKRIAVKAFPGRVLRVSSGTHIRIVTVY